MDVKTNTRKIVKVVQVRSSEYIKPDHRYIQKDDYDIEIGLIGWPHTQRSSDNQYIYLLKYFTPQN